MAEIEELLHRIKELEDSELDLKESAERLKREKALLDSIIELNPYAISIYDAEGRYLRGNRAYMELFGSVPPEDYSIFTDPILQKEGYSGEVEGLKRGESVSVSEIWYNPGIISPSLPDKPVFVRGFAFPLMDEKGELTRVVVMHEDFTERKRAEEELRENEQFLQSILDGIRDGITVLDREMNILRVNQCDVKERLGKAPGVGEKCFSAIRDRDAVCPGCPVVKVFETGSVQREVVPFPSESDVPGWLEISAFPIKDASGNVVRAIEHTKDITGHVQAREALKESEEKFSRAFEGNPGPIVISEPSTARIMEVNESFLRLSGYTREEAIGKTSLELDLWKNPEDRERMVAALKEHGSVRELEAEFKTKSGEIKIGLASAQAIEVAGETLMLTIIRDITDQKRFQEELVRERDFSDSLINSMPGIFYLFDEEGRFHRWNNNFENVSGYTREEISKMSPLHLFEGDDKKKIAAGIRRVFEEGQTTEEANLVAKSGETTPYYFTGKRITIGLKTYCCGLGIDITGQKTVEAELREKREILENILSASPIGIGLAEDRIIKWTNDAWQEIFGFKRAEEYLGKDSSIIYATKKEYDRIGDILYEALEKGQPAETDVKFRRKDGTEFDGHIKLSPLDPSEPRKRIIATFMDISWRKQAHEALKQSEQRYRLLVKNLPSIVYRGYLDWSVDFMDNKVEALTGYPMELFNSREIRWNELIVEEDFEPAKKAFVDALKDDRAFIREYRIKTRSGEIIWIQERGQIVCHDNGDVDYVSGVFFDINEQKKAQEDLKESEERYRRLSEVTLEGILFHHKGVLFDLNSTFADITGYARDEVIGKDIIEIMVAPEYRDTVRRHIASGYTKPYEILGVKKDGTTFPVEIEGREVNYRGKTLRVTSIRDITERKKAEEALRDSEEKYRMIFAQSPVGIIYFDARGVITDLNEKFAEIIGAPKEELIGFNMLENMEDGPARWAVEETLKTGSGHFEGEYRTLTGNKEIAIKANHIALRDEKGEIVGAIGIFEDITVALGAERERKRLEEQLRQSQKMEAVGTLAGGIAHDFNNLLQAIHGYADLLILQKKKDEPGHEELKEITRAAARGRDLTQQLLTFSRKVESKRRPINLNNQVSQMRKMLGRTIPKMIKIRLELSSEPKIVDADAVQIEQVIMNLTVNAKDAMPGGGVLTISTDNVYLDEDYCRSHFEATPGDYVLLSISDTGHGMEPQTVEHIFEPFYSTKETGKGTGLGLAIVYGIVKSHGGHINCVSEKGRGTTFNIYLPAVEYTEKPEAEKKEPEKLPRGSETILLVDDEEFIRSLGKKSLTAFGYTVITAPDGEGAIDIYGRLNHKIDLVILDLIMPGMGGGRCLEELVRINPEVKVVIASGYAAESPDRQAVEKWARGFIGKPYELRQMLVAVREALDGDRRTV